MADHLSNYQGMVLIAELSIGVTVTDFNRWWLRPKAGGDMPQGKQASYQLWVVPLYSWDNIFWRTTSIFHGYSVR